MWIPVKTQEKQIPFQVNAYSNGKDFMKYPDADLLFLDIELAEGEDGLEIAEQLMDAGNPCKICFRTSHTELARLGYRVNAFRYIDKRHYSRQSAGGWPSIINCERLNLHDA